MKAKVTKSKNRMSASERKALSLIAAKFKDKVAFPEQVENAKKYLQRIKTFNF